MPFIIHANLDAEAAWAGVALPLRVRQRISAMAPLLAALAPAEVDPRDVEVWAPAAVDPARLHAVPGFTPPALRVGTPPRADLAWAAPTARAANDRRAGTALARELGCALPGARTVASLAELDAHVAAVRPDGAWVCKAAFTAAGRDRAHGLGVATGELRARLANLFARHGELVFEPWLERVCDAGICATVGDTGDIAVAAAHGLVADARGGFAGIAVGPDADGLTAAERAQLAATARAVAAQLARTGYRGPLGLDAFAYTDRGASRAAARAFHPFCELNARYTFGAVALALARRTGCSRLGFGPPPAGAHVLVAASPSDPLIAWVAPPGAPPVA